MHTKTIDFVKQLLGGYEFLQFLGFLFWALVGAYILMQIHANTRDVKSARTPVQWSWKTFAKDNVRRIFFNLVLIIVVIRFSKETTGRSINDFWALVIGLSSDGLAMLLQSFNIAKLSGTIKPPETTTP